MVHSSHSSQYEHGDYKERKTSLTHNSSLFSIAFLDVKGGVQMCKTNVSILSEDEERYKSQRDLG